MELPKTASLYSGARHRSKIGSAASRNIYTEEFLLARPLLQAIRQPSPAVLLIDEIDKSDEEFESFLLEVLSDWQVSIPETGTVSAVTIPSVLLTSNNTRNLSHALRRRCLYLYLDYPNAERELDILRLHFPALNETLGCQVVLFVRKLRLEKLKKHPSISEVLDWTAALTCLEAKTLTADLALETLNVLIKYHEDWQKITVKMNDKDWFGGISRS
jgi:MoxR-like ATPase